MEEVNLTPQEWDREGWLALCGEHLDLYYEEEKDAYAEVSDDVEYQYCDHKGCKKEADYELYPGIKERMKNIKLEECEPLSSYVVNEDDLDEIENEIEEVSKEMDEEVDNNKKENFYATYRKADKKSKGEK